VRFFEIDAPATSAAKARGVAEECPPDNLFLIAADLGEQALSQVLSRFDRWDPTARSVIVAEGLLLYLSDEEVRRLFRELSRCTPPGSRVVFSHKIPDGRKVLPAVLRLVGEPFRSEVSSEDLPTYLEGTGWTVTSDVDANPAHGIERYGTAERA
jgi:O-methyltransferase involved in polyketide biosynthesis